MNIHLTIIDDDQNLANTLKRELENFPEIESIGLFASGLKFVEGLDSGQQAPDVVLMDISMGTIDEGIRATQQLHARHPQVKVIMFTVAEDDSFVFEAFKAGALGYLLKNEKPDFIHQTIVDVNQGGALMSPGIALKTIHFLTGEGNRKNSADAESYNLTTRELEILRFVSKGYTYDYIADKLFVSGETVKKHVSNIFKKLEVKNKIEAINKAKGFL